MDRSVNDLANSTSSDLAAELYLDLLRRCLTRSAFPDHHRPLNLAGRRRRPLAHFIRLLERHNVYVTRREADDVVQARLEEGTGWPQHAETMIGMRRLEHLAECVKTVIREGVPGDLIETGVWRGGSTILMRAVLKAYGDARNVWVADSFKGLPVPRPEWYEADRDDPHWTFSELAVSLEVVKRNFARYGLLDDQVRFLEGWFADTLPTAPIEQLALLRLDGDMYESTFDALDALYPKVSAGGYVIVDDYGAIPACKKAVTDYRSRHGIIEDVIPIDWTGVYWRRNG